MDTTTTTTSSSSPSHQYQAAPAAYHHPLPDPASAHAADSGHIAHDPNAEDTPLTPSANHHQGTYHSGYDGDDTPAGYYYNNDNTTGAASPLTEERKRTRKISKKTQKRLYWAVPLLIVLLILAILFEVYKTDFERWITPLTDWLDAREAWSWVIPVVILLVLSFPPLFGHEIVLLVVGLAYPLGIAIGIACAGAIIGEALCFVVFKYAFTSYAERHIREKVKWAAVARLAQVSGFWGVLVIRYSVVPPHLANPIFACTGMKFWIYMATVIASLPKVIVFVALGTPSSEHSKGARVGKVIAIGVVVVITLFATRWIRKKMAVATQEIEAERAAAAAAPGSLGTAAGQGGSGADAAAVDLEMGSRSEQEVK